MKPRSPQRQRGTVYLLVLSVTTMLVAIGVTAVTVGRIDLQRLRLEEDQSQARILALSAIEVVRYQLEQDAGWRTGHTHDVWSGYIDGGTAQFRYKLLDENDGDLADDPADPVRLVVQAGSGGATRLYSVVLRDGKTRTERFSVGASNNDAGESVGLGLNATTVDCMLIGTEGLTTAIGAVRFDGLPVEPGESVLSARVQFTSKNARSTAAAITVWAQAHDDAPSFGTGTNGISSRPKTAAQAAWSPGAWAVGERGDAQLTPDLTTVISEVVERPGWASGNAVVLILEGTGSRNPRTYDYSPDAAPVLHLTYTAPGLTADYTTFRQELAE